MADTVVDVVVQLNGEDVPAGRMWAHRRRGSESATFAYAPEYVARADAYALDPALPLTTGQQQTPLQRSTFGAFSDCAPDRWGRRLLQRTARTRARESEPARSLGEIDFLLGVRDDLRQGALRFRDPASGVYLADERTGVPSLLDVAPHFRLRPDEAAAILGDVVAATRDWRRESRARGLSAAAIERMTPAFEHAEATAAAAIARAIY